MLAVGIPEQSWLAFLQEAMPHMFVPVYSWKVVPQAVTYRLLNDRNASWCFVAIKYSLYDIKNVLSELGLGKEMIDICFVLGIIYYSLIQGTAPQSDRSAKTILTPILLNKLTIVVTLISLCGTTPVGLL